MREVEEALRRSEAKYRGIFENIQDIFFQTDDQGLIVEVSPSVQRCGYTREELIGMLAARVYEDPSKRITLLQLLEDGDITDREVRLRARDGRVVDFSISAHMLRGPDGSPAGMEGCLRDISDRKLAEEELRMHRDRLEELVDGRTAELTRANEELQREVSERGQAEEALGKRTHNLGERVKELNCLYGISNLVHRPDTSLEEILQGTVDLIPPGWQYPEVTCARITFNGQEFRTENFRETVWRQTSDIIVNGERTGAVEVCYLEEKPQRDKGLFLEEERRLINALAERLGRVIERKRAEEALRQPEERFSKVFQASSLAIAISSMRDGRIIDVNDALLEALNYSREEVIGRSSAELGMWADHTVREEIVRGLQTGDAFYDTEVEARGKTGGTLYAHLACVVIELDGEPCLLTITRDITEHKRAEEALRESEQRFRQVLDVSSDMIYKLDLESDTFDYISPSVLEMTGFTREEFIAMGPRGLRRRIHPEDWPDFKRGPEEFVELGSHPGFEYRLQCKDGEYRWLSDSRSLVRGEDGRPLALVGTVRDVSERKRGEEELQKSVRLLRDTGEMAKVGGWELDLSTKEVSWTEEVGRIHGVEPGYKPKLEEALNFYAPESRPAVEAALKKAVETGEPYDLESLFIPLGSKDKIWVRSLGKAVYSGGEIVRLAGTFQNIDEYKRADEALRKSEERHRILFETIAQGIVYQAADGKIISANPAAERILGLTIDQMQGRTSIDPRWKAIHEDGSDFPGETHPSMAALKTGRKVLNVVMGVFNPKDDSHHWININAIPLFRPGENKPYQVYTTFEDVTERLQAEEALRESEARYRHIFESIQDIFYRTDAEGIITEISPSVERVGYSREQLVGTQVTEV
jgi:PAS domain S-box-containing protein